METKSTLEVSKMDRLKKRIPKPIYGFAKNIYSSYKIKKFYNYDLKRFKSGYIAQYKNASEEQLEAYLTFFSHSIEKGLSHTDFRANFGRRALTSLAEVMFVYNEKNYNKSNERYLVALSVLKNYLAVHEKKGFQTTIANELFTDDFLGEVRNADIKLSGTIKVVKEDKIDNQKKNFFELSNGRHSVREFSDKKVDTTLIRNAVEISSKTPSVCNRQASRVYAISDEKKIAEVLKVQKGFNGYKLPPVLMLVTATNNMLVSPLERNEAFIDGGLFSMSLLYSLEYHGLAACALNAMLSSDDENRIKDILNVPDAEVLIMFIATGYFKEEVNSPRSYRDSVEKILKEI
ncbi:nitroreductase family protein [Enterococcus hirae]|nr:nitroreductase family protein [Enterococcus hirae]